MAIYYILGTGQKLVIREGEVAAVVVQEGQIF